MINLKNKHPLQFELFNAQSTEAAGRLISACVNAPAIIFLRGDLGSGKTTFSRGFLTGRGHNGVVKSPTYTLCEPYENLVGGPVYHFDLYRLVDPGELHFIGFRDYLRADAVVIIEWPERALERLPEPSLDLHLMFYGDGRLLTIRTECLKLANDLTDKLVAQ